MAVIRCFGLPGCGKTTTLAYYALKAIKSHKYKNVYANTHLSIHGVTYVPFDVFGKYEIRDCLFLVDEAMVYAGDRDHRNFGKEKIKEFVMHRHKDCDIILFSQEADGVDKKIRSITDRIYYIKKGFFLGKWFSILYRIPYAVAFPESGDHIGDIIMGYKKPPLIACLFSKRLYRPKLYDLFDSWESDELPPLPDIYQPYVDPSHRDPVLRPWLHKTFILLRQAKRYRRTVRSNQYFSFDLKRKKRRVSDGCGADERMQHAA